MCSSFPLFLPGIAYDPRIEQSFCFRSGVLGEGNRVHDPADIVDPPLDNAIVCLRPQAVNLLARESVDEPRSILC